MDGGALYDHLVARAGNHAYDGVAEIDHGDHGALEDRAARFLAWFERLFLQPPPGGDDAWTPPRLEYQFAASAPEPDGAEKVYTAEEYYTGAARLVQPRRRAPARSPRFPARRRPGSLQTRHAR